MIWQIVLAFGFMIGWIARALAERIIKDDSQDTTKAK